MRYLGAMKQQTWIHIRRAVLCGVTLITPSFSCGKVAVAEDSPPKIQIALLLDTSNSMDGLIAQAKTQLWRVCNTFIEAKHHGRQPIIEVALYEYGNDRIDSSAQWVRQIEPLTRDLDEVSRELFALRTHGGEEYCGAVIQRSITDLQWDDSANTYKVIFIAGNESFAQGSISAANSCKNAATKNVIVNSIYCGNKDAGINERWHDGPTLAQGVYLSIDTNQQIAQIVAPQDQEIEQLNSQLNQTYLAWGKDGTAMKTRQISCDQLASANATTGASIERCVTKATANYFNSQWDVVDAVKQNQLDLSKVEKSHLPKEMQEMTSDQRIAHAQKLASERKIIQEKILELARQRETFLLQAREKTSDQQQQTLDQALIQAVREQAIKKGYQFNH
jgi:hypothetical protein